MLKHIWIDGKREPKCRPNPAFPNGVDLDLANDRPACQTDLPWPAKRIGHYHVTCDICGCTALITTAGRPDDPRSVRLPCKRKLQ